MRGSPAACRRRGPPLFPHGAPDVVPPAVTTAVCPPRCLAHGFIGLLELGVIPRRVLREKRWQRKEIKSIRLPLMHLNALAYHRPPVRSGLTSFVEEFTGACPTSTHPLAVLGLDSWLRLFKTASCSDVSPCLSSSPGPAWFTPVFHRSSPARSLDYRPLSPRDPEPEDCRLETCHGSPVRSRSDSLVEELTVRVRPTSTHPLAAVDLDSWFRLVTLQSDIVSKSWFRAVAAVSASTAEMPP